MKKISVLLTVLCTTFLMANIANAQNNKVVIVDDTAPWSAYLDCAGEVITGMETFTEIHWNNKIQYRYKGEYVGEDTGMHYTWSMVQNISWKNWAEGKAYNEKNVGVSVLECEGEPVAITKIRYHLTVNAKGEVVVERWEMLPFECL